MWDLSPLTGDQTRTPCSGRRSLNPWTAGASLKVTFQKVNTELTEKGRDWLLSLLCNGRVLDYDISSGISLTAFLSETRCTAPGDRWVEHKRLWGAVKDSIASSERMED